MRMDSIEISSVYHQFGLLRIDRIKNKKHRTETEIEGERSAHKRSEIRSEIFQTNTTLYILAFVSLIRW